MTVVFFGVGAGVDPQLSTEGRGGSDGYRRARGRRDLSLSSVVGCYPYAILPDLKLSFPLLRSTVMRRKSETRPGEPWGTEWRRVNGVQYYGD